ncbi:MAG: GH3 auxin-responsive promoter family protein [Myxococcota bacterium]
MARAAVWVVYPLTVSVGIGLHLGLVAAGFSLPASSYAAVAAAALLVTLLEARLTHLPEWRARREDVENDLLYMVLVQGLLPVALALSLSLLLLTGLEASGLSPARLWPHAWPLAAQVVLMLLLADLLRYGLHVAAHRWEPLWRLHAVHHSPARLYWLNVGRFHPVEKGLQYLLDALPFVLVAVGADVLALYFVFYATNGFFQHSNVRVRLGVLNWLISGPELHRWHHSRDADQSCCNYGNNLIVWDLLFGTWFLPRDREVGELGLPNPDYPQGFGEQLKAPLVSGIDRSPAAVPRWHELAYNQLLHVRMLVAWRTAWRPLVAAAGNPREVQCALLMRILARNRETRFGREHGFASIRSYAGYRDRVSVQTYESLREYVQEQERTGSPALCADPPVMYNRTSGTTGEPKYIPVPESSLREQRRHQSLFAYVHYRALPSAYRGYILGIVSPAVEGQLETGTPFGSASGQVYRDMPWLARGKYVLPYEVFEVEDYELKYRLILRLAIVEKNITSMGSANPSTFLKLLEILKERRQALLEDVESGGFHGMDELPRNVRRAVARRLACSRGRLAELRSVLARPNPSIADLWPGLQLLTTWTGGSSGIALDALRHALPSETRVAELGYLASELRGSVPIDHESGRCVPTLLDNFFEFVGRERWEREEPEFLLLDELEQGREYYVVVTTGAGLYRYFMNDIVRVTGRFRETPTIAFVQKGKGVTNITGEKLYESQVIEAVKAVQAKLAFRSPFFVMLAEPERCRYRLLIECGETMPSSVCRIAEAVEEGLCSGNVEYAEKRASGRLVPLEVRLLRPGAGEAYKRHCVERGQREGQWKPLVLQYARDFGFVYDAYASVAMVSAGR